MKINLRIFRYIAYAIEIILLSVLQSTPNLLPELFGVKPLLTVSAALSFAAVENPAAAVVLGAVCGAAIDLAGGGIGFYSVALTLVCCGISYLLSTRYRANIFSLLLLSLAAVPLVLGAYFLIFRLMARVEGSGALFVTRWLPRMALTFICVPAPYFLNKVLFNVLTDKTGNTI